MIKDENQTWTSFFLEIAVLLAVVLFIRFYVFQFFRISGPSMCPTLNILDEKCESEKGEFIFVNEFLYKFLEPPKRGEIVVFHPPKKDIFYVKRIIGVPGDTIVVRDGKVFLNNKIIRNFPLPEPFLSPRNKNRTHADGKSEFIVPPDHFLLFGDNRDRSLDSRHCFSGAGCTGRNTPFVPRKNIQGRAEFVVWPFWKWRTLKNDPFDREKLEKKRPRPSGGGNDEQSSNFNNT